MNFDIRKLELEIEVRVYKCEHLLSQKGKRCGNGNGKE